MATSTAALKVVISAKDEASSILKGTGSSFNKLKIAAVAALGGIAFGAAKAIDAAIDFESAFAGVRKTVNATEPEFTALRKEILKLSTEIPVTANELSEIGEIAGQLGVKKDDIIKFTKTIADISVATNLTREQAATDFARIATVMNEPLNNIDKMASAVVFLGNNFATTEVEISDFSQRIAGAGEIAGLTTPQVFGIAAAMSSVGIEAEAGGTAVQKVLLAMNTAVVEGNANLSVFAQTAGMTAEEFKIAFEDNAGVVFQDFVKGLGKQGDQAITTLSELGLEDQRLMRAFLSLSSAGELVTETMDGATQAFDENKALVEEAEKRYATTESQIQTFKNTVTKTAIEAIEPLKEAIARNLAKLTTWLKKFDEGDGIVEGIKNRILEFFQKIDENTGLITMIKNSLDSLWNTLKNDLFPMLIAHKNEFILLAKILGGVVLMSIIGTINILNIFIKTVVAVINAFTAARNAISSAIDWVKGKLQGMADTATHVGRVIGGAIMSILGPIGQVIGAITNLTGKISSALNLKGQLGGGGGSFQKGTTFVPETGIYQLHKGEQVVPAGVNTAQGGGVTVNFNNPQVRSQSDLDSLVNAVKETLNRNLRLEQIGV